MKDSPGRGEKRWKVKIFAREMSCQRPPQQMSRRTAASLPDKTRQTRQQVGGNYHQREAVRKEDKSTWQETKQVERTTSSLDENRQSRQAGMQIFRKARDANMARRFSFFFSFLQSTVMSSCSDDQSCKNLISQYYSRLPLSVAVSVTIPDNKLSATPQNRRLHTYKLRCTNPVYS